MSSTAIPQSDVDIDVRAPMRALWRRIPLMILIAGFVAAGTYLGLSRVTPVYLSETTVLLETGESDLTRTTGTGSVLDREAIQSQVQLIRSRDLGMAVVDRLRLASTVEFNPSGERDWFTNTLMATGILRPPATSSTEESVLNAYYDRLSVYAVDNSRVIAIDFSSEDPELAAAVANAVAEEYIALQRAAKRDTTADAAAWLLTQIDDLRGKVQEAEVRVERYRTDNDLFASVGNTPSTLSQQQLSDLNVELTRVRASRADAEAKATQIRAALAAGTASNLAEVLNSPLIQRLVEQQVTLRSEIAQLNATLLPQHPEMRARAAQLIDLDRQIEAETTKVLASAEGEARLAASREEELQQSLTGLKTTAASANDAGVELRALEREAAAQRELMESYLSRYREAVAREQSGYLPADARVISKASVPVEPNFPKVLPMTLAATVAVLILSVVFVLLRELANGTPTRRTAVTGIAMPAMPKAMTPVPPAAPQPRWADDRAMRRIMPKEPTLVPEIVDRVEESLTIIAADIVASGEKRILVTLAEDSDSAGRPLGAVALARSLARTDARVVLVDLRSDGADAESMGEGRDLPGFSDLIDGSASFAQVIFRDRRSRVHFIPAGRKPVMPAVTEKEQLETVLSALALTYDYLLIDAGDDVIELVGPSSGAAMVVSEHAAGDPRTTRAFDKIMAVSGARIMLLVVDPAPPTAEGSKATAGAAA